MANKRQNQQKHQRQEKKRPNICQLSRDTGVDRAWLSRILSGKAQAGLRVLKAIAAVRGESVDEAERWVKSWF